MPNNNNQISVTYTDTELRTLVEEYITQQRSEFTLKGVCLYIHYWAVEDGKVAAEKSMIESYELKASDQERVNRIIDSVAIDGRPLVDGYKWLMKAAV